jgi:hypothetical protein
MFTHFTWGRILLAALALTTLNPCAFATGRSSTSRTTEPTYETTTEPPPPAGDPNLGILIIVGVVAFLILVAWIFSRTGDDGGRGPDRTLL